MNSLDILWGGLVTTFFILSYIGCLFTSCTLALKFDKVIQDKYNFGGFGLFFISAMGLMGIFSTINSMIWNYLGVFG